MQQKSGAALISDRDTLFLVVSSTACRTIDSISLGETVDNNLGVKVDLALHLCMAISSHTTFVDCYSLLARFVPSL
jgi:hypothetical protein